MIRLAPLLLISAFTSVCLAADPAGSFHGKAGLQLYSLRESFKTDVTGTLDKVKSFGFEEVETATTYGMAPDAFRKELETRGLKAVSGHFQYDALSKDLDAVIKE